jgi:hypothetical protein
LYFRASCSPFDTKYDGLMRCFHSCRVLFHFCDERPLSRHLTTGSNSTTCFRTLYKTTFGGHIYLHWI